MLCSWQQMHQNLDAIRNTFATITRDVGFHVGQKQLHAFLSTTFNSSRDESTLCLLKVAFALQLTLSLPTQCEWIYFPNFVQLNARKGTIVTHTPPINSSPQGIWLFTQTCQFTRLCQCHLELEGDKRPSSFYLGHFFLSKNFDHITKDASILHLKLGDSCKLSYFPTSTPLKHTSHHHNQLFPSC